MIVISSSYLFILNFSFLISCILLVDRSNIDQADFWNGAILLVDKPVGFSSFKLVYEVKKAICRGTNQKLKIGHAGTLDPLAAGLLILCTGKLTKQISQFQEMVKQYSGNLILGASRPTCDLESEIDLVFETTHIDDAMMDVVRMGLMGEQMMTPPIHSAVKVKGQRAYQLAREGKEVNLEPKPIIIHQFDIDSAIFPEVQFVVSCSKGTYIRSLVSEFGTRLQSGAYLSFLKRDAIGEFKLENAWKLDDLKNYLNTLEKH